MNNFFSDMSPEKLVWTAAFLLGFLFFVSGIIGILGRKTRQSLGFGGAALLEFISCWILYIPEEVYNDLPDSGTGLTWIEGIFTALLKSFNVYSGNGYERAAFQGYPVFSSVYSVLRVLANIALLLFVGGFILRFLNGPLQRMKLRLYRKRYLYIFSDCNEKTLSIARSIPNEGGRKKIIFAGCAKDEGEALDDSDDELRAVYSEAAVSELVKAFSRTAEGIEVFLFEDREEDNLSILEDVCRTLPEDGRCQVMIYAELLQTPWSMLDGISARYNLADKNTIVNLVRIEEVFVYSELLKHDIFENAAPGGDDNDKVIRALIVGGMNARNLEMLKALLHLSQMPGYRLDLTVIDSGYGRGRLRELMPEVLDDGKGYGDGIYHLDYKEGVDYESDAFGRLMEEELYGFTFGFVNAGDDLMNINLALRVKAAAVRKKRGMQGDETDGRGGYMLLVSILNGSLWGKWNEKLCGGLVPVGAIEDIYSYSFVTNSAIERASRQIHEVRYPDKDEKGNFIRPWEDYLGNEYNRHSVYARTLSFKYKVKILGDKYALAGRAEEIAWDTKNQLKEEWDNMSDEEKKWKAYEHMRWNMYTRTLGYRYDEGGLLSELKKEDEKLFYAIKEAKVRQKKPAAENPERETLEVEIKELRARQKAVNSDIKRIRSAAMVHEDLVIFDDLPLSEKIKDNLQLTGEVVKALQNIKPGE